MDRNNFDGLYEIFEEHLFSALIEECEDTFVLNVVDKYIHHLKSFACLPLDFIDDIREEAADNVYQMLTKKIYGHHNIKLFRDALKNN